MGSGLRRHLAADFVLSSLPNGLAQQAVERSFPAPDGLASLGTRLGQGTLTSRVHISAAALKANGALSCAPSGLLRSPVTRSGGLAREPCRPGSPQATQE